MNLPDSGKGDSSWPEVAVDVGVVEVPLLLSNVSSMSDASNRLCLSVSKNLAENVQNLKVPFFTNIIYKVKSDFQNQRSSIPSNYLQSNYYAKSY